MNISLPMYPHCNDIPMLSLAFVCFCYRRALIPLYNFNSFNFLFSFSALIKPRFLPCSKLTYLIHIFIVDHRFFFFVSLFHHHRDFVCILFYLDTQNIIISTHRVLCMQTDPKYPKLRHFFLLQTMEFKPQVYVFFVFLQSRGLRVL